jgi:hypothetical protein
LGIRLIRLVSVLRDWFGDSLSVVSRLTVPGFLTWKGTSEFLVLAFRWGLGSWARELGGGGSSKALRGILMEWRARVRLGIRLMRDVSISRYA